MNTNAEPRAGTRGRKSSSRSTGLLLTGIVAAVAALSLVAQVAVAGPPSPTGVPSQIQVGEGNKVFLVGHAVGVQIYTCNGSVWSSAVPRANLYGDNGKLIITHFAGPSWQAKDGSKAVGTVVNRVTVDPTAIPWVLLSAKTTPGPDGDRLVDTTFIQRLYTTGGLTPPAADCNAGTANTVVEVPYTADYFFWKHTGA
jgi:FtsP/CotA-like multicopper oxidase with cupredoxin domain